MQIQRIKFFQPIQVPTGRTRETVTFLEAGPRYSIEYHDGLIKILAKDAPGILTMSSMQNVQYMEVVNEPETSESSRGAGKKKARPADVPVGSVPGAEKVPGKPSPSSGG